MLNTGRLDLSKRDTVIRVVKTKVLIICAFWFRICRCFGFLVRQLIFFSFDFPVRCNIASEYEERLQKNQITGGLLPYFQGIFTIV